MNRVRPLPLAGAVLAALVVSAVVAAGCGGSSTPAPSCPAGESLCGSLCVDLQTNPTACGACGKRCPASATCVAGQCQCPAGQTDLCGVSAASPGACVDLQGDLFNCGTCGLYCGLGACTAGACVCDAPASPTVTECRDAQGAQCVDLASDTSNCGACRASCATREHCVDEDANGLGTCTCVGPQDKVCPVGGGLTACIDVWTDAARANCGDCGHACGSTFACEAGVCTCSGATPDRCPAPPATPTLCTSFASNRENCGGCGNRCPAGGSCAAGACHCPGAQVVCGATGGSPGACVDTATDNGNCGGCGRTCSGTCLAGTCCAAPAPACGTTCCTGGTGCCGTGCQPAHSNGLGGSYFNGCVALGTYTLDTALAAAASWTATGTSDYAWVCNGGCQARQTSNAVAVWCYSGTFQGRVSLNTIGINPVCPTSLSPSWD